MKKAELSINIVVMAAIAMLVLVILTVFVFRSTDGLVRSTTCESLGDNTDADCMSRQACDDVQGIVNSGARCNVQGDVCCLMRRDT
ncbi:MAG: hypothetical protein ACMXX9_01930 [Candidatus Woesearchaeota archaeon]